MTSNEAASAALSAAASFAGIRENSFREDCAAFCDVIVSIAKEISALDQIPSALDDAIISIAGDVVGDAVRALAARSSDPSDDELAVEVVAVCLDLCIVLLAKNWVNAEGVLQQMRFLLGDVGSPLEQYFQTRGGRDAKIFCDGRKIPIYSTEAEMRRIYHARALVYVGRKVRFVAKGSNEKTEGEVESYNSSQYEFTIKSTTGETVAVDVRSSLVDFVDQAEPVLDAEVATKGSYVKYLVPPTNGEALGQWTACKIVSSTEKDRVTLVSEYGERIDIDPSLLDGSPMLRYLAVSESLEARMMRAVQANQTAFADEPEWRYCPRPCARTDGPGKSVVKMLVLERFAKARGPETAIGVFGRLNAQLSTICAVTVKGSDLASLDNKQKLAEQLMVAVTARQFTTEELKTISLSELDLSIETALRACGESLGSIRSAAMVHRYRLSIWFQVICSNSLPLRLMAINRFVTLAVSPLAFSSALRKTMSEGSLRASSLQQPQSGSIHALTAQSRVLLEAALLITSQFVISERVVERIFGENRHLELVKRCIPLLNSLAKKRAGDGGLTLAQLDAIWTAASREEGETAKAIQSLLVDLLPSMVDVDLRRQFLQAKLGNDTIGRLDMDEGTLEFVHDLTLATFNSASAASEDHPGLSLLSDFVLEKIAPAHSMRLAIRLLAQLVGELSPKRRMIRVEACVKAVTSATKVDKVPQGLLLLQGILETFPGEGEQENIPSVTRRSLFGTLMGGAKYETRKSVVASLDYKHKLLKTVVHGLESFLNTLSGSTPRKGNGATSSNGVGRAFTTLEQVEIRLDFIAFLLRTSPNVKMNDKLLEVIWRLTVINAPSEQCRNLALRWFGQAHTSSPFAFPATASALSPLFFDEPPIDASSSLSGMVRPALGDDLSQWVLEKGFPMLAGRPCTRSMVLVLVDYFLALNKKNKNLSVPSLLEQDGATNSIAAPFESTVDEDSRIKRALKGLDRTGVDLVGAEQLWRTCLYEVHDGDDDSIFDILSLLLCRVYLNVSGMKDVKKVNEIRGLFIQKCLYEIGSSGKEHEHAKRRCVRLLRMFLLKAAASPSETVRIVLLPPLPGTPGSLSRREETPRSRTGPVVVRVSLGVTLGELRKEVVPQALDYSGGGNESPLSLRLVHSLKLDAMSAASAKWNFLTHKMNYKTLRELGFERSVVIQVYDRVPQRERNGIDDDEEEDELREGIEEDDDEDDDGGDNNKGDPGDDIGQYADATVASLRSPRVQSLDEEIAKLCVTPFDALPTSWPPLLRQGDSWSRAFEEDNNTKGGSTAAEEILKSYVGLCDTLLKLVSTPSSSISVRDEADLWDCYLALPPDPSMLALLSASAGQELDDLRDPSKAPFRVLAILRVLLLTDATKVKSLTAQVLALAGKFKAFPQTPKTCGLVFLACTRMLPFAGDSDRLALANSCLEWALRAKSLFVLRNCLDLVEHAIQGDQNTSSLREKIEKLWEERLLSSQSSAFPARSLVAAALARWALRRPELNVFSPLSAASLEELLAASRALKGSEFDASTTIGQRNRRRVSRTCEPMFLLFARTGETCSFEPATSPNPAREWFMRVTDALFNHVPLGFDSSLASLWVPDSDTPPQRESQGEERMKSTWTAKIETDHIFNGLLRLARGLLLRKDLGDMVEAEAALSRFVLDQCLLSRMDFVKTWMSNSTVEASLGLLSTLIKRNSSATLEYLSRVNRPDNVLLPSSKSGSSRGTVAASPRQPRVKMASSSYSYAGSHASSSSTTTSGSGGGSWGVDVSKFASRATKNHPMQFAGIGNLGATCYQNSLLQQLFHVMGFSTKLLEESEASSRDEVLQQIQTMFASMFVSSEQAIETKPFCAVMRDYDGSPISVAEQKDVQEFCDLLFTRLESASPGLKSMLEETFGGIFLQRTTSLDPKRPYESDRVDPFYLVPVDIKGKQTLVEALQGLVAKTRLVGENKCELPNGEKVDATVQTLFKKLPPHMMIHLKRFEFHYETMSKAKLDDYLSFPLELDMAPFMASSSTADEDESTKYELNGILVHAGGADSGHYYSFIRERVPRDERIGRQWYEFNDQLVWPYAPDRIAKDCFGGFDRIERPGSPGQFIEIPRSQSAYILVYDRVSVVRRWKEDLYLPHIAGGPPGHTLKKSNASSATIKQEEEEQDEEDQPDLQGVDAEDEVEVEGSTKHVSGLTRQGRPFGSFLIPVQLLLRVQAAEITLASQRSRIVTTGYDRVIFHPMFARTIRDVLELELARVTSKPAEDISRLKQAIDLALVYTVQVLARSSSTSRRNVVDEWFTMLETASRSVPLLSRLCLERVTVKADVWLKPIFLECPNRVFRRRFAEWLLMCAECDIKQVEPRMDASEPLTTISQQAGGRGGDLTVPVLYLGGDKFPSSRFVWLLDVCATLVEGGSSVNAPLPSAELFGLVLELVRMRPDETKAMLLVGSKRLVGLVDLFSKKSIKFMHASQSSALNMFSSKKLGLTRSLPLPLLILELASSSTASSQGDQSLLAERFFEAAMKLRDFSTAIKSISAFARPTEDSVGFLLTRISSDNSARGADDFSIIGDAFRATPSLHDQGPRVVDAMVQLINENISVASDGAASEVLAPDELLSALRCLGVVVAVCKPASDYLKTQHKKSLSAWGKDVLVAFKAVAKRTDSMGNRNGSAMSLGNINISGGGSGTGRGSTEAITRVD